MKYEIDENIIGITHCDKNFSCLFNHTHCLCEVVDSIKKEVIFIKPPADSCHYMNEFGFSSLCHCPTRKEIYKLYNIGSSCNRVGTFISP